MLSLTVTVSPPSSSIFLNAWIDFASLSVALQAVRRVAAAEA